MLVSGRHPWTRKGTLNILSHRAFLQPFARPWHKIPAKSHPRSTISMIFSRDVQNFEVPEIKNGGYTSTKGDFMGFKLTKKKMKGRKRNKVII